VIYAPRSSLPKVHRFQPGKFVNPKLWNNLQIWYLGERSLPTMEHLGLLVVPVKNLKKRTDIIQYVGDSGIVDGSMISSVPLNGRTHGPFGRCIPFSGGVTERIETTQTLTQWISTSDWISTMMLWVYISSSVACPAGSTAYAGECLFGDNGGYYGAFRYNKSGTGDKIHFYSWGSSETTVSAATILDQWVHYTFVRDGSNGYVYTNGVLSASGTLQDISGLTNPLYFGRTQYSIQFVGGMDDIRLYSRILSDKEIYDSSRGILPTTTTPPSPSLRYIDSIPTSVLHRANFGGGGCFGGTIQSTGLVGIGVS
jgi:hypothetical protein